MFSCYDVGDVVAMVSEIKYHKEISFYRDKMGLKA